MDINLIIFDLYLEILPLTLYVDSVGVSHKNPKKLGESMLDLVKRAERFARERHAGQFRKGAAREPYTINLEEVASLVEKWAVLKKQSQQLSYTILLKPVLRPT